MRTAAGRMLRASRRLAFAIGVSIVGLAWAAIGQVPSRAVAASAAEGPDEGIFPAYPGAPAVSVGGELRVDGRRVSTTTFRTRAAPADVIAFHRRHFEALPVDIVESALPDGSALFVLDVREGRRAVVTARATAGVTEVIRGWSPLEMDDADGAARLPALPDDVLAISVVDDGPAHTWTGHARRDAVSLLGELSWRFTKAGWEPTPDAAHDDPGGDFGRTVRFFREGKSATLSVWSTPEGGALVAIRILPGER